MSCSRVNVNQGFRETLALTRPHGIISQETSEAKVLDQFR
jgi:hypothetical protein